jgi:TPR repeat protein
MRCFGWMVVIALLLTPLSAHSQNASTSPFPPIQDGKSSDNGVDDALAHIGQGHPEWAHTMLQARAEGGNLEAQYHLAIMYEYGEGTPPDLEKALFWRTRAAQNGHAGAQADLGVMYLIGKGTKTDIKEGIRWITTSAEQGNAVGQRNLALSYLDGKGIAKNPRLGFELMTKAAQQDDQTSCRQLAGLYERGEGTKRNVREALRWYLRAAVLSDHSDRIAHLSMAKIYYRGRGVDRDLVKAHMWFSFAAGAEWTEWRMVSNPYESGYEARDFLKKTSSQLSSSQREQAIALFKTCHDTEDFEQSIAACRLE